MIQKWVKLQTGLVVEADRVSDQTAESIATWATKGFVVDETDPITEETLKGVNIETPTGMQRASDGDFVFKHAGEFFVCPPNKFMNDYGLLTKDTVLNLPVDPVDLVWYDDDGERRVVGTAELESDGNDVRVHVDISDPSWKKRLGNSIVGRMRKEI